MAGPDIQQQKTLPPINALAENNFDKLQKTYPNQKDALTFLDDKKFSDIKESLSKTIYDLSKENIVSQEDFWNNIQKVIEMIFSDESISADIMERDIQANNIFLFRTEFNNLSKQGISLNKQDTNVNKQDIEGKELGINKHLRDNLAKGYEETDSKYKPTEKQLENFKKENSDLVKQVKETISDENQQKLYIEYFYTGQQIVAEAQASESKVLSQKNYEFIQNFNQLNTDLGLENPIDLSGLTREDNHVKKMDVTEENTESTTEHTMEDIVHNDNLGAELVENNKDIENFVLDTGTDTIDKKDIQQNKNIQDIVEYKLEDWYGGRIQKSINELLTKNKLENYKDNFDGKGELINTEDIPEKDLKKLEKISARVIEVYTAKAQEKIGQESNKVIKEKAVGALLQNIGQYFQIDDITKQFTIDIDSGITFDKKMLKLSGNREGRNMSFYYDMEKGEVWTDDFVHHNQKDKTFYIDRGNTDTIGREKLPLRMPTLNDMLTDSQTKITDEMENILGNTNDLNDYEDKLNEVSLPIEQKSLTADIIIQHAMAKNIATQETHDFLQEHIPANITYSRDKNRPEYNLYKIIDTSMDWYTTNEINQRRRNLEKFDAKISQKEPAFADEMLKGMFNEEIRRDEKNGKYDKEKGPKIYQFMDAITYYQPGTIKNEVIDLDMFKNIVNKLESTTETTADLKPASSKYQKLRNDRETDQQIAEADHMDFKNLA